MPPPGVSISEDEAKLARDVLDRAVVILEGALSNTSYLVSGRFTVADLNVASVLSPAKFGRYSFAAYARTDAWLRACFDRPAQRAVLAQLGT